jgi:hypothetical protein
MKKEIEFVPGAAYYKGYSLEQALQSVGEGWHGLLREVYDKMATLDTHMDILQVKEKWGGLRIYTSVVHDVFDKFLIDIERKSFTICEFCGSPGALRKGGWYRTLCDEHSGGNEPINPF